MTEARTRPAVAFFPGKRPEAPFSRAVRVDNVLYLSGEIGVRPDGSFPPDLAGQTRQMMDNVAATLTDLGLGMDAIVKVTVMLADMDEWPAFNTVYLEYFDAGRLPARSAFGAGKLVGGCLVEVECIAHVPG